MFQAGPEGPEPDMGVRVKSHIIKGRKAYLWSHLQNIIVLFYY